MKKIGLRFLVAAMAVVLGTAIARSQTADAPPPPPMHGHEFGMEGHGMGFFARYLDLSDAQREQMKAVVHKERPVLRPLMQQLHQTREQLKQYEEGTYNEVKVRALAAQQAQTMVELTVQQTRIHNELFQLLTSEQQSRMKEFEANREERMQEHMHDPPPAPPEQ